MFNFFTGTWEGEIVFNGRNETHKGDRTIKTQTIPSRHVAVSKPAELVPFTCNPFPYPMFPHLYPVVYEQG